MITKVFILCAVVVAVSSNALVNTGVSSRSRVNDGKGNYAFEYAIDSAGAKRSRSEVGSGIPIKTAYALADSHIAPVASVALGHAGGAIGIGGLGCGGLGCGGLGVGGLGVGGLGVGGLGVGGLGVGGHGLGGLGLGGLGVGGLGVGGLGVGGLGAGIEFGGVGKLI